MFFFFYIYTNSLLETVFGVVNKSKGIVDAYDKQEVKSKVQNVKDLDEKEMQRLQKQEDYVPQFSKYLADRKEMIGKTMMLKARRKGHMPLDKDGKPIWPYTNLSESMNNVMSQAKTNFLNFNNKGKTKDACVVTTAKKPLVGRLMTISDMSRNIGIKARKSPLLDTCVT